MFLFFDLLVDLKIAVCIVANKIDMLETQKEYDDIEEEVKHYAMVVFFCGWGKLGLGFGWGSGFLGTLEIGLGFFC